MDDDKNAVYQMRFPQKLWYLLNMRTDAILWGGTGRTILLNYRVLHNYLQCDASIFKTTNISSFVRQLNLYGFRKVTSHLQDPLCNSSNPYMHEYIHDYFQIGHPELLNKITRKALTMRKHFKPKGMYGSSDQFVYSTPLQKARRALHIALRKAAQDLLIQNSPKFCNLRFEYDEEDNADYCEEEENLELDWILARDPEKDKNVEAHQPASNPVPNEDKAGTIQDNINYEEPPQDLMNFNDESQPSNDNFPSQFLSMPELDPVPTEQNSNVELLAEFNIEHDSDQGIITQNIDKNDHNSLNCVLPSISSDHNDFVSMAQHNSDDTDQYHEWDQMFNDIIANKGPSQECGSDLKELYSQISRTIDLLNS